MTHFSEYSHRDFSNNLLTKQTKHKLTPDDSTTIKKDYEHDNRKRLISTSIKMDDNEPVVLHHNTYDELGQLAVKKLHSNTEGNNALQSLNYSYNMRGWMKKINNPANLGNDFFGMELHYAKGTNPTYHNGNISSMKWKSKNFNSPKTYNFTYDGANRLTKAKYGVGDRYNVNLEYSKNGNIQLLERNGKLGGSSDYGLIDVLDYSYQGNQLKAVDDNEGYEFQTNGYTDNNSFQNKEYFYDANGNLTRDDNKQIADICYTYNNLPERIKLTQNRQNIINYVYDAAGNKIIKKTSADRAEIQRTDYIGNFIYKQEELAYILHKEGRIVSQGDGEWEYQYFLSDHLGNTRIAFNDKNKILQDKSYYPFGMLERSVNPATAGQIDGLSDAADFTPDNKYLYNGKELQDDFGLDWYDYGARMYDPVIGRWHVQDSISENYVHLSPYNYVANNPITSLDPDGNVIISSAIATKVVVGAAIGAGIDVATQISSKMALKGQTFDQAVKNIDLTSVGASAITGAAGLPGGNSLVKTATIASAIGYDASTDYSIKLGSKSIYNGEKSSTSASVDAGMDLVGLPKTKINNEGIETTVEFVEGNIKPLFSKKTKEMLKSTEKLLDNDGGTGTKQNNNVISPSPMDNTETERPYWQINF